MISIELNPSNVWIKPIQSLIQLNVIHACVESKLKLIQFNEVDMIKLPNSVMNEINLNPMY